ncbi:UNVERIFIED_CONTAM: hypothetical protein HDU68_000833 [Siphonaria sp. JEL0065]|nr:hypothetical protein HDU68_000833 [Siphonaria sp. JEL0065]
MKRQELETLAASNAAIEPTWTDAEVAAQARNIVNEQISPILAYPSACIYPCFAARYSHEQESTAFLTQRGGSYESTSRGKLVSQKASRRILTKSDGSIITASQLWAAGFQRKMLYEQRNWVNMAALEKKIQQILALGGN